MTKIFKVKIQFVNVLHKLFVKGIDSLYCKLFIIFEKKKKIQINQPK